RSVTVAGSPLQLRPEPKVMRDGGRVTLDRGPVRESYDLALEAVEQTFAIDAAAGDVAVELDVVTDLRASESPAGLAFGNHLGRVDFGAAHVVVDGAKRPITTEWSEGRIRMLVPAALRGAGPVVIDPLLRTTALTQVGSRDSRQPDIAYDATNDVYMVVWEYAFSATDSDVWTEMRS